METVRYNFEKKCIGYLLKYYRKKRNIKIDDLLTKVVIGGVEYAY